MCLGRDAGVPESRKFRKSSASAQPSRLENKTKKLGSKLGQLSAENQCEGFTHDTAAEAACEGFINELRRFRLRHTSNDDERKSLRRALRQVHKNWKGLK